MVAHNGGRYLPRTLAALANQTRPADVVLGIDVASSDDSYDVLQRYLGKANVRASGHRIGFGAAVATATGSRNPDADPALGEWLWLLHDDAAPAPDALAELLQAVERAPSVSVAGCKQLDWDEPRKLLDVGLSTSRWAERVTRIDFDEQDQGQYDGRSDVFAVNSAGMLVRRDVWDALHGFDPALPGIGDDLDFCWRNRLAGNRVVVVPTARMFHVVARPDGLSTRRAGRRAEIYLRLKHAALWKVPLLAVGAVLGGVSRLMTGLLFKDPGGGAGQFLASWSAVLHPVKVAHGRAEAERTRTLPPSVVRTLQTPRREVWAHRRTWTQSLTSDTEPNPQPVPEEGAAEPSGDFRNDFVALATANRMWSGTGATVATVLLLAAALVTLHQLIGAAAVTGGALLPLSGSLSAIWNNASAWWISLGAGLPGHGDPFAYVLWLLAALGWGNGSAAVSWLLILSLPLAGLGAWFAAGALTTLRWPRFLAALAWAAAPALQIALAQGRLGALLAHLVLPWVALGLLRASGSAASRLPLPGTVLPVAGQAPRPGTQGTPSWTAAAAAGLGLAVVTAAAPVLLLPAILVVGLAMLRLGRRGRTLWWALLPSVVLFVPFLISTLDRPRALLADPGVPLAYQPAPLWQQLLGQPVHISTGIAGLPALGSDAPWSLLAMLAVGVPILLLAVAALFLPVRSGRLVRGLWLTAVLGLVTGYAAARFGVALGGDSIVPPFTGPAVSVTAFALLAPAVLGLDAVCSRAWHAPGARPAVLRSTAVLLSVLLALTPAVSLSLWVAQGIAHNTAAPARSGFTSAGTTEQSASQAQPGNGSAYGTDILIGPASPVTVPATAADRGEGPERSRTLVIHVNPDGSFSAALMRGSGTAMDALSAIASTQAVTGTPGSESIAGDDPATSALRTAVATVTTGSGVDPRPELAQLGVAFIVLQQGDTAAELLASQIEAVPGLATVGPTNVGWLWRVTPPGSTAGAPDLLTRVRVVDANGSTLASVASGRTDVAAEVPAGPDGRQLVLAERSDERWSAWLDGQKLQPDTNGDWNQSFALPAAGGHLEVRFEQPGALWWNIAQGVVLLLTLLLAIPMPARRVRVRVSRSAATERVQEPEKVGSRG
ncbi:MAG: glycosyl transferase [Micrococcaceae bacterium]|nr:glycosyl transferase [Micrococcaceae bacterium]